MSVIITNNGGVIHDTVKFLGSGNVILHPGAQIRHYSIVEMCGGRLEIGSGSVLGFYTMVQCTGTIIIGENTLLGPHSTLLASYHEMSNNPDKQKQLKMSTLQFGDNVWGGAGVVYNHGIIIGHDAVIGANSFVNKTVIGGNIVAGSPARFIREKQG